MKTIQRRLVKQLFFGKRDKGWTRDKRDKYLSEVRKVCRELSNHNEQPGGLERLGQHLHAVLAQQSLKNRTKEEVARDFGNAGTIEPHPTAPDVLCWITDHHGNKASLPKMFVPESLNWPMDKILADPHPSEGRPFKSNDCVRLMTDKYIGHGLPKGIEGYVSGVVSNQFLGWKGNFCQVMFIVACKYETTEQDEITVWDDFLEVEEDQLQLCNKKHPPSLWFPFQVAETGQVIRDQQLGRFEYHTEIKPYTYQDLWDVLTAQARQPRKSLQQEGQENLSPSYIFEKNVKGVERLSFPTKEKSFEKEWNRIKDLSKMTRQGARDITQKISKKFKQFIR